MSNPAKARGSKWELDVSRFLGLERQYGAGRRCDTGDIAGDPIVCYECKAARKFDLAGWVEEARAEARNKNVPFGVVVVKSPGAPTQNGYVVMDLETWGRMRKCLSITTA